MSRLACFLRGGGPCRFEFALRLSYGSMPDSWSGEHLRFAAAFMNGIDFPKLIAA